jgi:hypothetical protein
MFLGSSVCRPRHSASCPASMRFSSVGVDRDHPDETSDWKCKLDGLRNRRKGWERGDITSPTAGGSSYAYQA